MVVCKLMNTLLNGWGMAYSKPPGNPLPIWPMLPLPWLIFWPLGEGHALGHTSFEGGGDVRFCCLVLFVCL